MTKGFNWRTILNSSTKVIFYNLDILALFNVVS